MMTVEGHITTLRILGINGDSSVAIDYLKNYITDPNAFAAFFKLSPLLHNHKLREAFEILPHSIAVESACQFTESVLPIYEAKYPSDDRPRQVISAAREFIKNPTEENRQKCRTAAYAADAANAAYATAANAAANAAYAYAYAAAANAAAYAAAAYAANAANAAYAAYAAYAANAAANAANAAKKNNKNYDKEDFEAKQIEIVINVIGKYREYYGSTKMNA